MKLLLIFKLILLLNIIVTFYTNIVFISNFHCIRRNIIKNSFNLKKFKTDMDNFVCHTKNKIMTKCQELTENPNPLLLILFILF